MLMVGLRLIALVSPTGGMKWASVLIGIGKRNVLLYPDSLEERAFG